MTTHGPTASYDLSTGQQSAPTTSYVPGVYDGAFYRQGQQQQQQQQMNDVAAAAATPTDVESTPSPRQTSSGGLGGLPVVFSS